MIYPGTEMYTMAKATGKIDDDYWLTDKDVPYFTIENGGVHTYEKLLEMKETIRQAVSLQHIFTPEGFLKQRKVIPSLLKYSQIHHMNPINNILNQALTRFNLLNDVVKTMIIGDPTDKLLRKISVAFEKVLIEIVMNHNNMDTPQKKKQFIDQIVQQTKEDNLKLIEYAERTKAIKYKGEQDKGDIQYKQPVAQ